MPSQISIIMQCLIFFNWSTCINGIFNCTGEECAETCEDEDEFLCADFTCINKTMICDGTFDCLNDELNCGGKVF